MPAPTTYPIGCCSEVTVPTGPTNQYRQARTYSDGTLVDVWLPTTTLVGPANFYFYNPGDGICYYIDFSDTATEDPGTVISGWQPLNDTLIAELCGDGGGGEEESMPFPTGCTAFGADTSRIYTVKIVDWNVPSEMLAGFMKTGESYDLHHYASNTWLVLDERYPGFDIFGKILVQCNDAGNAYVNWGTPNGDQQYDIRPFSDYGLGNTVRRTLDSGYYIDYQLYVSTGGHIATIVEQFPPTPEPAPDTLYMNIVDPYNGNRTSTMTKNPDGIPTWIGDGDETLAFRISPDDGVVTATVYSSYHDDYVVATRTGGSYIGAYTVQTAPASGFTITVHA